MSSLWTPSGEHQPSDGSPPGSGGDPPTLPIPTIRRGPTRARRRSRRCARCTPRLVATPVEDVIANHALGLWQVALVHLGVITPPDDTGTPPAPDLASAGLAIDAMAALVDGLGPRLGVHEQVLRDALTQAQMLFVEVSDPPSVRERSFEPVVLTGAHVRLEPLAPAHVPGLVAAAAEDRSHLRLDAGARRRSRDTAAGSSARGARARVGPDRSRSRRCDDRASDGRRVDVVPRSAALAAIGPRTGCSTASRSAPRGWPRRRSARSSTPRRSCSCSTTRSTCWNVHRVVLNTDARNERSRAAIARIGATFEGVLHSFRMGVEGTPRDTATLRDHRARLARGARPPRRPAHAGLIAAASHRPRGPGTTSNSTACPTSIVAGAVGDHRAVERDRPSSSSAVISPSPRCSSNALTLPVTYYCTILAIGISRMPVAPLSFRAGMSVLMSCLATTVSTA